MLSDLLFDYTLRTVALGSAVLGIVSGMLGCFAMLRRQSLLGDAIAHAALPGIVLAFLLTSSKTSIVLMLGALFAGWLGTLFFMGVVNLTRIKSDSALGIVLSVFFGIGLVLLTFVQKRMPDAAQAGLDKFLFGQAAALMERDVVTMASLGFAALLVLMIFWKEFKLLSFDPEFGASLGYPVRVLDVLLTTLLVIAIVIGLQTVGVILMSAMIVAPAAAARQWTDKLGVMVALSALFGAIAGISGSMISSFWGRIPTGPTIVLCISFLVGFSMLLAPNRGLVWNAVRRTRNRRKLMAEGVLCDLYELALQHESADHAHAPAVLRTMNRMRASVGRSLRELENRGWAKPIRSGHWALTEKGRAEAERISCRGKEEKP